LDQRSAKPPERSQTVEIRGYQNTSWAEVERLGDTEFALEAQAPLKLTGETDETLKQ